ncbi:TetR family transcriptional regulator [Cryobacterium sp. TMT1-3]|uniref:TetR family transcriptional regulator n=1 Tax=Cryobacterium luteum TaxID=1424661 RepID=A0A1H8M636_9MICO|nr:MULTISPECIES: TetR family transcriptional regulator [Cryobacterium]TFB92084.1 TetR family transcriptional regulator [Cryobacterium luteum]TFC27684.1 TetR family transcriptional regulator [Cryobacterium sp. TMT1-3]SEO12833.1 transcriptional regulator, TetR family [Cryobacterium luteum]
MTNKSQHTRRAILAAARAHFAERGYERSTVRAIGAAAGIDAAMVIRYFGSKENLFAHASEFALELPDLAALPHDYVGEALAAHFLELWEANESLRVLLRSGVTNAEASAAMRGIFGAQLVPIVAALGTDRVEERAALAASQMLGLALARYILAFPPMVSMGRDELVAFIGPTLQRYLVGELP